MARGPALDPPPPPDALTCIAAHPDDESWACGGLLWAASAAGVRCRLVFATGVGVRAQEARSAAGLIGADCTSLGLPDGGVTPADARRALEALPAGGWLVTLDEDGGYGHRDHVALTEAVLALGRPTLLATTPRDLLRGTWARLRALGVPVIDAPGFGGGGQPVALGPAARAGKRALLGCHASQGGATPEGMLGGRRLAPLLAREWYRGRRLPAGWLDRVRGWCAACDRAGA